VTFAKSLCFFTIAADNSTPWVVRVEMSRKSLVTARLTNEFDDLMKEFYPDKVHPDRTASGRGTGF
jgi:hypothetical protein